MCVYIYTLGYVFGHVMEHVCEYLYRIKFLPVELLGHWVCIFLKFFYLLPVLIMDNENLTLLPTVPNQIKSIKMRC